MTSETPNLLTIIIASVIMLDGFLLIVGGPDLVGRVNRRILRLVLRQIEAILRWALHLFWTALVYVLRFIGRMMWAGVQRIFR